ncbi:uncharacterized protein BDR25DRAFT_296184 [Lindgomyces ingoldianus]|uniref:Uncharacterized protein n=1 Tax=Lindgomyces ingoldianus TaxID=673940 RepID=A0ACB6QDH1_9PLEO|nr:uncharacterized protein BDR25DRAFT_296184 [Lindgomyces ingoldianus]KAF2464964.1 hypothetical protein BDR25DRAFT_296184 [Lindgomyces ingoldianus]
MDLPLHIKKQIYSHLLLVPGLVFMRQYSTPILHHPTPFCNINERRLEPGVAYTLTRVTAGGTTSRFWRHYLTNVAIVRTNRQVYEEARPILYGENMFEMTNLTNETSPPAQFGMHLFPWGCNVLIRKLCFRAHAIYPFAWLLNSGHIGILPIYRELESVTLIVELEAVTRGLGKALVRMDREKWVPYVQRIYKVLAMDIFGCTSVIKSIPIWIDLRVIFDGEPFIEGLTMENERGLGIRKIEIKRAVSEAFELFKRGGF